MGKLLALALALAPAPAEPASEAAPPVRAASTGGRVVLGVALAPELPIQDVDAIITGHLVDTGVDVDAVALAAGQDVVARLAWARGRAGERDVLGVFWVERGELGVRLFLLLDAPERVYVRELEEHDDPQVTVETLGVIIRGLSTSLGDPEGPRGMDRVDLEPSVEPAPAPVEPAPVEPAPVRPARVRPRLFGGLGYAGSSLAGPVPWHSGIAAWFGLEHRSRLLFLLTGHALLPATARSELAAAPDLDARLKLERYGGGLRLGYRLRPSATPRLALDFDAGLSAEWMRWRPVAGNAVLAGGGGRLGLGPGFGVGGELFRGLGLSLHVQLDLWAWNTALVAEVAGDRVALVRPAVAGVMAWAGVHFGG